MQWLVCELHLLLNQSVVDIHCVDNVERLSDLFVQLKAGQLMQLWRLHVELDTREDILRWNLVSIPCLKRFSEPVL